MKTIVVHAPKGGCGKSTLTRELAVALPGTVAIVDLDPQGTTRGWYERRSAETPVVVAEADYDGLREAGADWCVVDTAPGTTDAYRSASASLANRLLREADLVLVPARPTPDDLLGTAPIAKELRSLRGSKPWAFVITQVPPRSRFLMPTIRHLAALGQVAPEHMGFRVDYPSASIEGGTAFETIGSKASKEIRKLMRYVEEIIDGAA